MKLVNKQLGLGISVDQKFLDKLFLVSKGYYPNEFGGLLIGRYLDDNRLLSIEDFILPLKYKSSRFSFVRDVEGLRDRLTGNYIKNPSLIYVGEWHTHPDNSPVPSITDFEALQQIVNHTEVYITNPVMLILGINTDSYEADFYVLYNKKMYKYEKEN